MGKFLYIAEKPSVAQEFAKALKLNFKKRDGYLEADNAVVARGGGAQVTKSYTQGLHETQKRRTQEKKTFFAPGF